MSYKFSRGSQVIGDLKAADDTQRDTKIDFGEDYIGLETSGSVRMVISGSDGKVGIGVASPSYKLDVQGDIRVRGNDIRDNSGNPAVSFDGSANTTVVNDLTVGGTFSHTPQVLKVGLSSDFTLSGSGTYQTLSLSGVQFDTFTGGAGWNTGSYNFVATEAGYYEFQASFIFDVIQSDVTQYQIYLVSTSSASTLNSSGIPFLALNQYNNNPAQIDMRTFHLSTIANFSVNQSASIQVRQIDGTANQTVIKSGLNQTFLTIRKL